MRTVASRWIITRRPGMPNKSWHKANLFGWSSTREKHWPNWTLIELPIPCECLKGMAGTTGLEPAASAVTALRD